VQRLPGLCRWLLQHGQHPTSLRLRVYGTQSGGILTQLPCPNLRELDLGHMQVQLSASSTQQGVLHSCTRLTKLLLQYCQFADGHSSLAALSALVRLQHLELQGIMGAVVSGSTDGSFMPSTALQHLTQLTHMSLRYVGRLLNADSLQHVSCLVNLQELDLFDSSVPLSPSTAPGLSSLTALRKVRRVSVNLDPSILQDCTQLQDLELNHSAIVSAGGAAALHSLLGRLQQLHSLKLFELEYDWPVAAAAYSSLTASTGLQQLQLTVENMPAGVWPHVFPPDRQLPALHELIMFCMVGMSRTPHQQQRQGQMTSAAWPAAAQACAASTSACSQTQSWQIWPRPQVSPACRCQDCIGRALSLSEPSQVWSA